MQPPADAAVPGPAAPGPGGGAVREWTVAGPVLLLALGLIGGWRRGRLRWWFVAGWLGALAGGTAAGLVIMADFGQLFSAYPRDLDGTPLGPSRFASRAPYWQALAAAGGQLAVCAVMIALIAGKRYCRAHVR